MKDVIVADLKTAWSRLRYPEVSIENERLYDVKQPIELSITTVTDADKESRPIIREFWQLMARTFNPAEVSPLERFEAELSANCSSSNYTILVCISDPFPTSDHDSGIISAAYGSVYLGKDRPYSGMAGIRYTATSCAARGTGIGSVTDREFMRVANEQSSRCLGMPLVAVGMEAVESSEAYWNQLRIEDGNGARRLYTKAGEQVPYFYISEDVDSATGNANFQEGHQWVSLEIDGETKEVPCTFENLQMAVRGFPTLIPSHFPQSMVGYFLEQWYTQPKSSFLDETAFGRHVSDVQAVLEANLDWYRSYDCFIPKSFSEREPLVRLPRVETLEAQMSAADWASFKSI